MLEFPTGMYPLALVAPSGLRPAQDGSQDPALWLAGEFSPHTRRAYAAGTAGFLRSVQKPLCRVTQADLETWAAHLGQGSLKPASRNRSLTVVKSLLSFAQQTGYLPFNVGDRSAQACYMGVMAVPPDPIFPTRKAGAPLDPSEMQRIVYPAARRAGLEQKVPPWMRPAHASHALDCEAQPPRPGHPGTRVCLHHRRYLHAPSHRKARASICPIDGSHYFLDAKSLRGHHPPEDAA